MNVSYYTINNMAECFNIANRTINCIVFQMQLEPCFVVGYNRERYYSIYKMELIKMKLEGKARVFKMELDFFKMEINTIYQSKMNYENKN